MLVIGLKPDKEKSLKLTCEEELCSEYKNKHVIFLLLYCEAENILWSPGIWLTFYCSWHSGVVFLLSGLETILYHSLYLEQQFLKRGWWILFDLTVQCTYRVPFTERFADHRQSEKVWFLIFIATSRVDNCSASSQIRSLSLERACRTTNFVLSCSGIESRTFQRANGKYKDHLVGQLTRQKTTLSPFFYCLNLNFWNGPSIKWGPVDGWMDGWMDGAGIIINNSSSSARSPLTVWALNFWNLGPQFLEMVPPLKKWPI